MSIKAKIVKFLIQRGSFARTEPTTSNLAQKRAKFTKLGSYMSVENGTKTELKMVRGVAVDIVTNCSKPEKTIIYVHGGGFVYGDNQIYMHMLSYLSRVARAEIFAVRYRLAPESRYPSQLHDVDAVIDALCASSKKEYFIIGDSAGGNLVLSVSLRRRNVHKQTPAAIILISPVLDATFSNKWIIENRSRDNIISKSKLKFFVSMYAPKAKRTDAEISPFYANLEQMPPVLFLVDKNEVLYGDSLLTHKKILAAGGTSRIREVRGLWHGWPLFTKYVPESREAIDAIAEFIAKRCS